MTVFLSIILFISYLFFDVSFYGAGWWIFVLFIGGCIDISIFRKRIERIESKKADLEMELAELKEDKKTLEAKLTYIASKSKVLENKIETLTGKSMLGLVLDEEIKFHHGNTRLDYMFDDDTFGMPPTPKSN